MKANTTLSILHAARVLLNQAAMTVPLVDDGSRIAQLAAKVFECEQMQIEREKAAVSQQAAA